MLAKRVSAAIACQKLFRSLGQESADFSSLSLDVGNYQRIVAGRSVPHPGDYRSFGSSLDRDLFGSGDGATADGGRVIGDGLGELVGKIGVRRMESQKRHDRSEEVFDIFRLDLTSPPGSGRFLLGEGFGQSLCREVCTNLVDGCPRGPDASGEGPPSFLLGNDPMVPGRFDTTGQSGVTWRQKYPAGWHGQDLTVGASDGARFWTGRVGGHEFVFFYFFYRWNRGAEFNRQGAVRCAPSWN